MISGVRSSSLALAVAALLSSQAASAAPLISPVGVDPLVSLSLLGTAQSRSAVCSAGAAAVSAGAAAAQAMVRPPGCVLPVAAPPPAPVMGTYLPPAPMVRGPGVNPADLFALFLFPAALFLVILLEDDDEFRRPLSPR